MKVSLGVIVSAFAIAAPAQGQQAPPQAGSGNDIYAACTDQTNFWFCAGAVAGMNNTLRGLMASDLLTKMYCAPNDITNAQYRDVLIKWLRDNPARRNLSAPVTMILAYGEAWPCPSTPSSPPVKP